MIGGQDLVILRGLVGRAAMQLTVYTHRELSDECVRLGLPEPPSEGTKRERIGASLGALQDADVPKAAERVLTSTLRLDAELRNSIQDKLWSNIGTPELPKRTRREIAHVLDLTAFNHADAFMELIERLWVLESDFVSEFLGFSQSLRTQIEQHIFRNPGDWTAEQLFEHLGVFSASDTRFAKFLEGLVSSDVIPDEPKQRAIVSLVNPHLLSVGAELREISIDGGYPVFSVVSTQTARNRQPKNIIFASAVKPDIRFVSAVDNDIEILGNTDDVLIYERPVGADGIRWRDLQDWWKETHQGFSDEESKRTLYAKLIHSLPDSSPPQRNLFELYHAIHGRAIPDLPALLPEVWLFWDHKTVKERGREALLHFRMDFLLLLPHLQRVVIEVDGLHHYSTDGQPDTKKYADNMHGDRDLKLSGYEVFRFGAAELYDRERARPMLEAFFKDLFHRFTVGRS